MKRLVLALVLPAAACGVGPVEDINAPWGGFDLSVEEPLFGSPHREQFMAAGENVAPQALTDNTPPPAAQRSWAIWAAWGHLLATRDDPAWTDWTGTLSVDDGSMSLLRTLAFDRHDRVEAAPDEGTVAFTSRTRPHFDGLVTRVTSSTASPTVTLQTTAATLPMATGAEPSRADATLPGSTVRAIMLAIPLQDDAPCAHGVFTGRWRAVEGPRARARGVDGRVLGRLLSSEGALVGHWRGFTGTRADGNRVVFGKLIDADGNALARLRGTVEDDRVSLSFVDAADAEVGSAAFALEHADDNRAFLVGVPAFSRCLAVQNAH